LPTKKSGVNFRFEESAELINADKKMKKTMWGQFWSAHQRFFKYLCIASKVSSSRTRNYFTDTLFPWHIWQSYFLIEEFIFIENTQIN
jgi:hypothetical protein